MRVFDIFDLYECGINRVRVISGCSIIFSGKLDELLEHPKRNEFLFKLVQSVNVDFVEFNVDIYLLNKI